MSSPEPDRSGPTRAADAAVPPLTGEGDSWRSLRPRKTPKKLTPEDEREVCRAFAIGAQAKALAARFDVCKGTITTVLRKHECRRCDLGQSRSASRKRMKDPEARRAAVQTERSKADRFVMDLPDGASFGEAARAAALSAVAHLKEGTPRECQAYLRAAQMLEAADQRATGGWGDPFADTPGRRAALDILREAHGLPRAGEEDEISLPSRGGTAAPAAWVGGADGDFDVPPTRSLRDLPSPEGEGE